MIGGELSRAGGRTPKSSRFNGAADRDRRRGFGATWYVATWRAASTEPPIVFGGEASPLISALRILTGFNGAADRDRRRVRAVRLRL